MDLEQIGTGHVALSGGGYLPLEEAATASGIDAPSLLREASEGRVQLYHRCGGIPGHLCSVEDFLKDIDEQEFTQFVSTLHKLLRNIRLGSGDTSE